jgi:isoleucyl-tRNA synthetase
MAMEYKDTLNLPRTDFAMRADLVTREPERLKKWEAANLYAKIQASRATAEKFVLHDGPPFANGDVHVGTALNKILKDIIVKYKTLRGFSAPYIPGWDCHGLPIEFKVAQQMTKEFDAQWPKIRAQHEDLWKNTTDPVVVEAGIKYSFLQDYLSPENIRSACEKTARHFIGVQREQFKRLGVLGDWENPYLTLNKEYEADELRMFADIVEKGFVYRGKKPVYWSIPCRTALAEAEVEYADHVSQSVFVKFPVVGQPNTFIVIWTTTPWTLPANLAVAYNDKLQYVQAKVGEENFILFRGLLPAVAEKCGWTNYTETLFVAEELAKLQYQHPFCNRTGKAFAADFVTSDTGTGFVHIAPGHGQDDYNLGLKVGLPIYSPVTDLGVLAPTNDLPMNQQMPESLIGKSLLGKGGKPSEANEAVLALLREKNVLLHQENYHHSYPHCWRSKTPVIFRAMNQWFIEVDHDKFRERALDEISRVNWIPDWGVNRIKGAVQSRPDWCISRQRTWGVPIPFFYDANGQPVPDPQKNPKAAANVVRKFAKWFEEVGTAAWFSTDNPTILLTKSGAKEFIPAGVELSELKKSNDTLDVWIDSGSSSRAVLKQRKELQHAGKSGDEVWQADVYLEGSDQHRGWFQSSLLLSLAGNGAAPFKTVLTHGFMVDADREKISKSKQGGYEKPQTAEAYVKKYGADVVRLWVASQDYRSDIVVSEERINKVGETYRGIRNALRYQLSNLYDFDPAQHTVADDQLTGLDRWILGEFAKLEAEVLAAYDAYEFHVVYQKLSQFIAVELSSVYHDVIKDRLYTDAANSPRRRSTQTALHRLATGLCQMLAPILAFTADEAWEFIPGNPTGSVHEANWQPKSFVRNETESQLWKILFALRANALPELEKARQSKFIGKALDAKFSMEFPKTKVERGMEHLGSFLTLGDWAGLEVNVLASIETNRILQELLNVSKVEVTISDSVTAWKFNVTKADGQKCERCWHWETDIGQNTAHPTICGRCIEAVLQLKG